LAREEKPKERGGEKKGEKREIEDLDQGGETMKRENKRGGHRKK